MTREESIEIFKRLKENAPNEMHLETVGSAQELFSMAISALEQQPYILDRRIDENTVIFKTLDGKEVEYIRKEPCDDVVSRQWLMRKATERFYTTNYFNHISAMIEEAPSVTHKSDEQLYKNGFAEGMNATVMCEKCGKPLGVFDGNICTDCSKIEQIRAEIEQSRYGLVNDGLDLALKIIDKYTK